MFKKDLNFTYNQNKANVILQVLLKSLGGEYDYVNLLKLVFFADRYHIRKYGRPVSGDKYFALKLGPIPSFIKDIINDNNAPNISLVDDYKIKLINTDNIDYDELSKSDLEAIKFAVDKFGELGKVGFKLADISHAYPEWVKFKSYFIKHGDKSKRMYYQDFLDNADPNHEEFKKNNITDPFEPITNEEKIEKLNEIAELNLAIA